MWLVAVSALGLASMALQGCPAANQTCSGFGDRPNSCATMMLGGDIVNAGGGAYVQASFANRPNPSESQRQACRGAIVLVMSTADLDARGVAACGAVVHGYVFLRDT